LVVCFYKFLTPFTLGGRNFLISNQFLTIVSVSDVPRGGVQVLFGHQKQRNPPFGSSLPWELKCSVTGRSTLHMEIVVRVLFFNFVMWSHTGDDPQTESAKFDYMLEWKVKIYKNCVIFWLLAPTNILHMEISKKKFLKIWWLWPFLFFTKNPLYELDTRCFLIRTKKD